MRSLEIDPLDLHPNVCEEVEQDAALSQGRPRNAAVNFDTYRILQRQTDRQLTVA